ncbi:MAG: thiamine diphosphokinase [Oscillospiraceae bacterium]|jgi:thiamine pyrophosphokinase|nr:thiamine diphosphokinase [Oscillospiraceae bacterium]
MRCVLLGAAPAEDINFIRSMILPDDFLICVDGGIYLAIKLSLKADLFVSDMDSSFGFFPKYFKEKIFLPAEKDDTDMLIAIKEGISRGFKNFLILGGLSGRFDHTYANLCVLKFLCENNLKGSLCDENNEIFILKNGFKKIIKDPNKQYVSFFPFGCNYCVLSAEGFKYPLKATVLRINFPQGVSNEFIEKNNNSATVFVNSGTVLVVLSKDKI